MDKYKASFLSLGLVALIGIISWLVSSHTPANYCSSDVNEYRMSRDWVVENSLSSGFLSIIPMVDIEYGDGGVKADSRDVYAVSPSAYCLNVKYGEGIFRLGRFLSFFMFFSFAHFGFSYLIHKLRV